MPHLLIKHISEISLKQDIEFKRVRFSWEVRSLTLLFNQEVRIHDNVRKCPGEECVCPAPCCSSCLRFFLPGSAGGPHPRTTSGTALEPVLRLAGSTVPVTASALGLLTSTRRPLPGPGLHSCRLQREPFPKLPDTDSRRVGKRSSSKITALLSFYFSASALAQ